METDVKQIGPRVSWTEAMKSRLAELWANRDLTGAAIADLMGLRLQQIYTQTKRQGLKKLGHRGAVSFWSRVSIGADSECWEWSGGLSGEYGATRWKGKTALAHRVAYQIHHDIELPRDLVNSKTSAIVMHICDNPPCCNPAHLRLGTMLDNTLDSITKGRWNRPSGENHPFKRIPERWRRGDNHPFRLNPELAARGDKNGARLYPERLRRGSTCYNAKLKESDIADILNLHALGMTQKAIAARYGVSKIPIRNVIRGTGWKHALPQLPEQQHN
jgi:hypothetical protein